MATLATLIHQCAAALAHTPDAVLTVRADVLLAHLEELQRVGGELPLYAVGDLIHYRKQLVKVFGVTKAANKRDRYWYRVGSRTVAMQEVRESALADGIEAKAPESEDVA